MKTNPEHIKTAVEQEHSVDSLKESRSEHIEKMRERLESAHEQQPAENMEKSRQEALENATSIERTVDSNVERQHSPAERRNNIHKADREASYRTTMDEVRTHMSGPSRAFSKVIHNETIEKVSEIAGATVARPNAVLTGAFFAFTLTLAIYLIAKNSGYPLSGFESIGTFILGWVVGITYDFIKVMVTGRK